MRVFKTVLFSIYFCLVTYIVFFARRRHGIVWSEEYLNLIPIRRLVENYGSPDVKRWDFYSNLFGNTFLFIPLPIFVQELFPIRIKSLFILGFFTSVIIEAVQYSFQIGVADIDDVLLNTLGTVVGIVAWSTIHRILVRSR